MGSKEHADTPTHQTKQLWCDGGSSENNPEADLHYREEEPQGLLYFTRYNSVPIMVDALFDSPTSREFTQSELAEKAELSPRSVSDRLDVLHNLGIIKEADGADRFSINLDAEITWKLKELDGLIKQTQGSSSPPTRDSESDSQEDSNEGYNVEIFTSDGERKYQTASNVRNQVTSGRNHAD